MLFKVHLLTGIPNNIRFNNRFQLNVSLAYLYFQSSLISLYFDTPTPFSKFEEKHTRHVIQSLATIKMHLGKFITLNKAF